MFLLYLCTCKHFRNRRVLRVFGRTAFWLWLELDHIRLLVNREHLRPVAHQHSKHHLELSLIMNKLRCVELLEVLLFALLEESIQKNLQTDFTVVWKNLTLCKQKTREKRPLHKWFIFLVHKLNIIYCSIF